MAYRPTNDTKENVIHRNTIFDGQGMVSCCTCGYCIKKTEDATLELTNFKAAPPIVNEQSIGSGVLEFSDYMIPKGSFGGYVLTPLVNSNPFNPTGVNSNGLVNSLNYFPFRNCSGTTTIPASGAWRPLPSVIENAFPYGASVADGTTTVFPSFYCAGPQFPTQNVSYYTYYKNAMNNDKYLTEFFRDGESITGSYDNFANYVGNHDINISGINVNNQCENNVLKIFDPVFYLDVSGYSFSYTHPNYTISSSSQNIYTQEGVTGKQCLPNSDGPPVAWSFDQDTLSNRIIYKGGYILNNFYVTKNGSFDSEISINSLSKFVFSKENSPFPSVGFPTCRPISKSYFYFLPTYGAGYGSLYNKNYFISNPLNKYPSYCGGGDYGEIFYGIIKDPVYWPQTPPDPFPIATYDCYPTDPTLPIKYKASKTNRTQITSTTDATGRTTLTIRNVLWTGKNLFGNVYTHNSGANRPNLASGKVPLTYQAVLKGGFESDIIVSFQSIPYCNFINIPDRLKRVDQLKVHFENYEKVPQLLINSYYSSYYSFLDFFLATPNIKNTYATDADFYSLNSSSGFNSIVYYGGLDAGYFYKAYREFENVGFIPPNVNSNNEFFVTKKPISSGFEFSVIKKDFVPIDPPVITSYVAKSGRAYPDFGVADRFKSCLLINGDADVWKTGNEVQFVGLGYLVTNGGSGYTSVPTVTLFNGGGTGATAYARISNGKVISVTVNNKGKNYTSNKTVVISGGGGTGATAVDISFTPFYSIYMEEIKDEKQTAGQSLIRIATTLENANNGIYIPNVGLETLYKDRSLSVKFLYGFKDVSKENLPRYENVNLNDMDTTNDNAEILNANYTSQTYYENSFNSIFNFAIGYYSEMYLKISFYNKNIQNDKLYGENVVYIEPANTGYGIEFYPEVISLSPLKIKYSKVRFDNYYNANSRDYTLWKEIIVSDKFPRTNIDVVLPWMNGNESHLNGALLFGFQCDVILEEVVDEFIQEALPASFNQILQNIEFIQTSNMMNSRTPIQMINPEQCEHIGKVIDRKNCNCPKKWIRECDVHGKTDWEKCITCKDFKLSE